MAARRSPPPRLKVPSFVVLEYHGREPFNPWRCFKGTGDTSLLSPLSLFFFPQFGLQNSTALSDAPKQALQVLNHFLCCENYCAVDLHAVTCIAQWIRQDPSGLACAGLSARQQRWKTPDMVEARMGGCWSCIQVAHQKFEKLQYDHKRILVSVLHGWKTLTVLQQVFYLTNEEQIAHLVQPLNSCI